MKKIIFLLLLSFVSQAQIKIPQVSPKASLHQTVGLTDIEIEYSRPSARNRSIYGELIPFGKTWRAGANENTTISFSDDVILNGTPLSKGKYALYIVPKIDEWQIIFYKDTNNWGLPEKWDDTKVAVKVAAKTEILHKHVETFTIGIGNTEFNGAHLEFSWEKTFVSLGIEVPTNKNAIASIDKVLNGPTANDYFTAAQYYFNTNLDLKTALNYVNKAYELNDKKPYWYTRLKSQILAKQGNYKEAIEMAKISLEGSKTANNTDYIKSNEESIKEWSKK